MGKKNNVSTILWLILLGMGGSCQKNRQEPAPQDTSYFPLQIGDYWIYQIVQEKYITTNSSVKYLYQFQERISSSYYQNNQLFYLIEESMRQTEQSGWKLTGFHTVYKSPSEVITQENNVFVVALAFPIALTTFWNSNVYNTRPDTLLHYQNLGHSFAVGQLGFKNTVSVAGANDSTLVNQIKKLRVYAPNIGLVYREETVVAFCQSSSACIGKSMIESGTKLTWELIAGNRLP